VDVKQGNERQDGKQLFGGSKTTQDGHGNQRCDGKGHVFSLPRFRFDASGVATLPPSSVMSLLINTDVACLNALKSPQV